LFVKLHTGIVIDADKIEEISPIYVENANAPVLTKLYDLKELETMGFNINEYTYHLLSPTKIPAIGNSKIYRDGFGNAFLRKKVDRYLSTFKLDPSDENSRRFLQDERWFYPKEKYGDPVYYIASIRNNTYSIRLDEYRELENKLMVVKLIDSPPTASLS